MNYPPGPPPATITLLHPIILLFSLPHAFLLLFSLCRPRWSVLSPFSLVTTLYSTGICLYPPYCLFPQLIVVAINKNSDFLRLDFIITFSGLLECIILPYYYFIKFHTHIIYLWYILHYIILYYIYIVFFLMIGVIKRYIFTYNEVL